MPRRPQEDISEKQLEILEMLISSTVDKGYQPSQAELAVMTGTTRHAVSQKIKQLILKKFLEQPQNGGGERCLKINGLIFKATLSKDWLTPNIQQVLSKIIR